MAEESFCISPIWPMEKPACRSRAMFSRAVTSSSEKRKYSRPFCSSRTGERSHCSVQYRTVRSVGPVRAQTSRIFKTNPSQVQYARRPVGLRA